ncbi:hypothetical protein IVA80_18700 [Bradyrhizobium sp. 139]|uniref:hypothetical protein n=1 Tax=Bradyrhizobium sp. 139 TaxID=2782616 RepID=UPI001FFA85B7|nr:hypothetical protein [Bradyrhizobium sp. 139]MCK1742851.1 hypothetical protein [Bradyrhizobium sp. 139]
MNHAGRDAENRPDAPISKAGVSAIANTEQEMAATMKAIELITPALMRSANAVMIDQIERYWRQSIEIAPAVSASAKR